MISNTRGFLKKELTLIPISSINRSPSETSVRSWSGYSSYPPIPSLDILAPIRRVSIVRRYPLKSIFLRRLSSSIIRPMPAMVQSPCAPLASKIIIHQNSNTIGCVITTTVLTRCCLVFRLN